MKRATLQFLGTGASTGIPMIGCACPVCTSKNVHNQRLRPSALIQIEDKKLLIDTTPDLRFQALKYHIHSLDGVLLTHTHYDHIAGIDELRVYYVHSRKAIPVLLSKSTHDSLKERYAYLFKEKQNSLSFPAQLEFQVLPALRGKTDFLGIPIHYLSFSQGGMEVTGFRFGSLAYLSDLRNYSETIFEDLKGAEILVLSALRHAPSQMHFTIDEAIAFARKVGASKTYLMHLNHEVEHESVNATLPEDVQLAHDGLTIDFDI